MRHDWIFDVLSDLLAYSMQNDLPRLAAKVTEVISEARQEIGAVDDSEEPPQPPPTKGRHVH